MPTRLWFFTRGSGSWGGGGVGAPAAAAAAAPLPSLPVQHLPHLAQAPPLVEVVVEDTGRAWVCEDVGIALPYYLLRVC